MTYGLAKARYTGDATQTVSPARLLTMLFDKLVSDLRQGEEAMLAGNPAEVGRRLTNAQAILLELHSTLDVKAWDGAQTLSDLYVWLMTEIMTAHVRCQPQRVADCRRVVEPLREAWHEAAHGTATGGAA